MGRDGKFKGKCRNCVKPGHKVSDRWESESDKHKRPTRQNRKKEIGLAATVDNNNEISSDNFFN